MKGRDERSRGMEIHYVETWTELKPLSQSIWQPPLRHPVSYQPPTHRRSLVFPVCVFIIGEDFFVITSRQFFLLSKKFWVWFSHTLTWRWAQKWKKKKTWILGEFEGRRATRHQCGEWGTDSRHGTRTGVGDGGVFRTPCADFSRPVEELEYTCLLKSTFTEASHVRGFKTCQTPATYPECVFCGKMYQSPEENPFFGSTSRNPCLIPQSTVLGNEGVCSVGFWAA